MSAPPSASLYVGDLQADVTEGMLFDIFNPVGPVASIRVCRDTLTRRSLGYAYVNFHNAQDAERALDTLNNTMINGRVCRIMWSQRDPSIRRSGVGNIFIKNLDPTITHKELYDTFSAFGNILSCKVQMDEKGVSKGFGFVHFESQESAEAAIKQVNGMLVGQKEVYVAKFLPKKERLMQKGNSWSNVYVKDLDTAITESQLTEFFEKHGKTTSVAIMRGPDGVSKGFGFVCFEKHDEAAKAVEALHNTVLGTKKIWCGPAQKKSEREQELKTKFRVLKLEQMTKYSGINLYIKNLEDEVNEERLKKEFSAFGNIKSARIMIDDKVNSKGFGFVCYTTPEEAQRAISEMNSRILQGCTKPLYVALHEPKEVRRHKLIQRHNSRNQMRAGPVPTPSSVYPAATQPVFYGSVPTAYYYPNQVVPRGRGTWTSHPASSHYPAPTSAPASVYPGQPPAQPAARGGRGQGVPMGGSGVAPNGRGGNNRRSKRNPGQGQSEKGPDTQAGAYDLTVDLLQQLPPEQQKMHLGERLYPLIHKSQPSLAGKITGMLLDSGWSNDELLALIKDEDKLLPKIQEAVDVLASANVLPPAEGAQ
jgi:polyadenylate-binding protein